MPIFLMKAALCYGGQLSLFRHVVEFSHVDDGDHIIGDLNKSFIFKIRQCAVERFSVCANQIGNILSSDCNRILMIRFHLFDQSK